MADDDNNEQQPVDEPQALFGTARVVDSQQPRYEHEPVPGQVHDETTEQAIARGVDPGQVDSGKDDDEEGGEQPSAGNSSSTSPSSDVSSVKKSETSGSKPAPTTESRTEADQTDSSTVRSTATGRGSRKQS